MNNRISISEACQCTGEKPAVIINWCLHHKIGEHVRRGDRGGDWLVDPDRLEALLERRAAA